MKLVNLPSTLAYTRKQCPSGPLVMKVLVPLRMYFAPLRTAVVVIPNTSVP